MEHEMAMRQMRAHLARAGREIRSARQYLETPAGMDTIEHSLSEQSGS
jgi:hypothetical protein